MSSCSGLKPALIASAADRLRTMLPSKIREKHGTVLSTHFKAQAIRTYLASRGSPCRSRRKKSLTSHPRVAQHYPRGTMKTYGRGDAPAGLLCPYLPDICPDLRGETAQHRAKPCPVISTYFPSA